ncbi:MAG: hypothetical protein A2792_00200 [Sphingomonadales bacterium RIFCSPHIGHO2_01_FULL_65_20]|nr:MAG: hypothetical protein A2792_00200 [Sphingomonadales bacterium RIFCSPHIGHO2_01_FULL_65_20]
MDGDTFWTCSGTKVRLVAASGPLDAPEMPGSPRCNGCDPELGRAARDRMKTLIVKARAPIVKCDGVDRYKRALCTVSIDGVDLGDQLVAEGHGIIEEKWRRR